MSQNNLIFEAAGWHSHYVKTCAKAAKQPSGSESTLYSGHWALN
jgi:hypothetical protein